MANGNSPVTGVIDETAVVLDSGQYEGKTVSDIQEIDPEFYQKLANSREKGAFSIRRHKDKSFRLHVQPLSF